MKQPTHLLFVCQNLRGTDDPRGSCMRRGSQEVLDHLKARRNALGLKESLRVMGASCLGACESGITALIVDGRGATFYGRVDVACADAMLEVHALGAADDPALARHRLPAADLLDLSALEGAGEGEQPSASAGADPNGSSTPPGSNAAGSKSPAGSNTPAGSNSPAGSNTAGSNSPAGSNTPEGSNTSAGPGSDRDRDRDHDQEGPQ